MISKLMPRLALTAVAGLSLLALGLGILTSTAAQADAQPEAGRICAMPSAKNVSYFAADTTFTIRTFNQLYTYKCDNSSGRWNETITWLIPPITFPNGGVLEAAP